MAKQRGIHQIKGKINNLCYYEQKYVRGGLIRRINEAMSERLKTDPAFANTRVANTIFGGCSQFAKVILSFFGNRNLYLFLPSRHALLTKAVQKYLLLQGEYSEYPDIGLSHNIFFYLPEIIESIVKNSIFDSFNELEKSISNLTLNETVDFTIYNNSLVSYCKKYNCIGVQFSISRAHYIYTSSYDPSLKAYSVPDNNAGGRGILTSWYLDQGNEDLTFGISSGDIDDAATFWIISAQPVLSTVGDRPLLGRTGACFGVITFKAE